MSQYLHLKWIRYIAIEKSDNIDFLRHSRQLHVTLWSVIGSDRISSSFKLLCMSSLPVSMKRIGSRTAEKKRPQFLSHYKSIEIFRRSRTANSAVGGRIWPNFELLRAIMQVIITCKYENDRMKNSREKSGIIDLLDA